MTKQQLFEKLKNIYCKVGNQNDSDYLFRLCQMLCPELEYKTQAIYTDDFYDCFTVDHEALLVIEEDCAEIESKARFTYEEMVDFLISLSESNETNIPFTNKELFFLRAFLGGACKEDVRNIINRGGLIVANLIDDLANSENSWTSSFNKIEALSNELIITDKVFIEKKPIFKFKCGIFAIRIDSDSIKIGDKKYLIVDFYNQFMPIFDLTDEVTIDNNTFYKDECLEFVEKLKKL